MPRLHHVNIIVPIGATDHVVTFYRDALGFALVPKPSEGTTSGGAWFDIDDRTQLHVSERTDPSTHRDAHFAIVADDFEALLRRLAEAGAPWQEQPDLFGGRRGSTRDPLGNRVEICEAKGTLAGG